jgi:hypothetical protein
VLTRRLTSGRAGAATAAAACALLFGVFATPGTAAAGSGGGGGGGGGCNVVTGVCTVGASSPPSGGGGSGSGGSGGGGSGGGPTTCSYQGKTVDCYIPGEGYWDGTACYDELDNPQPPASSSAWEGHDPTKGGAVYMEYCPYDTGPNGQVYFLAYFATSPPGQPAQETPGQVAQGMYQTEEGRLYAVAIGSAPAPGSTGLVGLPVWVWTKSALKLKHPLTAHAGAFTVYMYASIGHITWSEDGGSGHTCPDVTTAYSASYGLDTPVCGFAAGFATAGSHTLTATAYWGITWTSTIGIDQPHALVIPMSSTIAVTIDQAQALNVAPQEAP